MKIIRFFLTFMAFIAVKTYAQKTVVLNGPSENYAVNSVTSTSVNSIIHVQDDVQTGNDAERSKSFSKSFSVDNNDKVNLNNQYGSIQIKTWDKKEVRVDIDIKAYSNSDSDAQSLIDHVNIDANKNGDVVSIKTIMGEKNGFFGKVVRNGNTRRRELKVSYVLYMPAINPLNVLQQYGNVEMGNFSGPTSLKIQYGNLTAGSLSNSNNYINVQYGKADIQDLNAAVIKHEYTGALTIGAVGTLDLHAEYIAVNINTIRKSADIKVQYGKGLTIGNIGGNVLLNTEYAKVNINTIHGNAVIKESYGDLTIASVGKVALNTEYTNVTIGSIKGDANIDMDYNRLNISEVTAACKNFTFNGEYVSAGIGFGDRYHANFNVSVAYAGFKYGASVSAKLISDEDETKKYSGKIGNGAGANVNIKSEYGSVVFK